MAKPFTSKILEKVRVKLQLKSPNKGEIDCAGSSSEQRGGKPPGSGEVEDVFAEFRRVTLLMSVLAAINSDGRQVLDSAEYQAHHTFDGIPGSLERTQSVHRLVTTALAILLVRNNEVVAVTSIGPQARSTSADHQDTLPHDTNLHELALREASPRSEADLSKVGLVDFIAVRNPQWVSGSENAESTMKYWKNNPEAHYMVLPPGKSHWDVVSKDSWSRR